MFPFLASRLNLYAGVCVIPPSPHPHSCFLPQAVTDGVLKVMSKMGISTIASYKGSQVCVRGRGWLAVACGLGRQPM